MTPMTQRWVAEDDVGDGADDQQADQDQQQDDQLSKRGHQILLILRALDRLQELLSLAHNRVRNKRRRRKWDN